MRYNYTKAKNFSEFTTRNGVVDTPLDFKTFAKDIPCQNACPAKTNVPLYIEQIFQGNYDAAYRINLEDNVFPGVLGRVCTRPCESACRHNWTNIQGPVQICHLKRISADFYQTPIEPLIPWYENTGKSIAIIGGGPAGLAAARELFRFGHSVTIFEREPRLGGMMIHGIPRFRLPAEIIEAEIDIITRSGITVQLNSDITYETLKTIQSEYDAVLLTTGTSLASQIDLDVQADNCMYGNDFMYAFNTNTLAPLSGNVLVIGGGFTAVDCARSCARAARKLMGEQGTVSIVYRRNQENMAANFEELEEIVHEHISIQTLCTPVAIVKDQNKITGVTFVKNKLEVSASGGKPSMKPIPGSEFTQECDYVIVAIGQTQDYSILGLYSSADEACNAQKKLFSAGDFRTGGKDVITAVADAKQTARQIDEFLMGTKRRSVHIAVQMYENEHDGKTGRTRDFDLQWLETMPTAPLSQRAQDPDTEVEKGFELQQHASVSSRCYLCHYKFEIDHDKCIHCNWCIEVTPRKCISRVSHVFFDEDGAPVDYIKSNTAADGTYIHIDSDECVRCGKCLRVCPTEAISMVKMTKIECSNSVTKA
ncbi:MAG TPA: FAD-dependent oxidoreductase [Bacteroidales bacterium]|nr:MAG: Glutamate synthase (NADPH) small chain [Bacteroidetes bacterium ADurb.Bin217]HPM12324.1 FAD-dependent oxidoreductase [Bacteroidales bacterium]